MSKSSNGGQAKSANPDVGSPDNARQFNQVHDYICGAFRTLLAQVEKVELAAPWILSLGL
jgi:hypothetical protein